MLVHPDCGNDGQNAQRITMIGHSNEGSQAIAYGENSDCNEEAKDPTNYVAKECAHVVAKSLLQMP